MISVRHMIPASLIMRASSRAGRNAALPGRRFVPPMRSPSTSLGLALYSPTQTFRTMSTIPAFAKGFPDSTAVPSTYFKWPGTSESSTKEVRRILEENDRKYDIYEKVRCEWAPSTVLVRLAVLSERREGVTICWSPGVQGARRADTQSHITISRIPL